MANEENITKILLLGETGVGKSSFGNYLIGKKEFLTNGFAKRVTTQINGKICQKEEYKDIYIIDSPGFQDTNLDDEKIIEELQCKFQDQNAGVRAICLLLDFSSPRFLAYLQKQMYIYCLLFPIEKFWEHVSIVFTKVYYYTPEDKFIKKKKELESKEGLLNEIMNYIKEKTEEINKSKKDENDFKLIKIPDKLPVYYIDSDLETEESQNWRTEKEVYKLIEWARKKEYLDLKNINKNMIDPNFLSSERIDDFKDEKKCSENQEKLIIKYYERYKKTTFHNKIVYITKEFPYKIEEIETKLVDEKKEGKKNIQTYKKYKRTKEFIKGIEQKDKEKTIEMQTKKISKELLEDTTEKKKFKDNIYYCFNIINEETIIEYDDDTPTFQETKEKFRIAKYFQKETFFGEPYPTHFDEYTKLYKKKEYEKENVVDENGNILEEGIPRETNKIINFKIDPPIVGPLTEYGELEEKLEYDYFEKEDDTQAQRNKTVNYISGASNSIFGAIITPFCPWLGVPLMASGSAQLAFADKMGPKKKITIKRERKIKFKKEYQFYYQYSIDGSRKKIKREYVKDLPIEIGNWYDC